MKTFREWMESEDDALTEHAIAVKGDWKEYVDVISDVSETVTNLKWLHLKYIPLQHEEFEFRQLRNSLEFVVGHWVEKTRETKEGSENYKTFEVILQISLSRHKSYEKIFKYPKLINVDGVGIVSKYSGKGLALAVYKLLVNEFGYTILGDSFQYYGARRLWSRLSKELDVKVDIINTQTKQIEFENVILHHGNYDQDFDQRLWSYEGDKKHLRTVLTKIL